MSVHPSAWEIVRTNTQSCGEAVGVATMITPSDVGHQTGNAARRQESGNLSGTTHVELATHHFTWQKLVNYSCPSSCGVPSNQICPSTLFEADLSVDRWKASGKFDWFNLPPVDIVSNRKYSLALRSWVRVLIRLSHNREWWLEITGLRDGCLESSAGVMLDSSLQQSGLFIRQTRDSSPERLSSSSRRMSPHRRISG